MSPVREMPAVPLGCPGELLCPHRGRAGLPWELLCPQCGISAVLSRVALVEQQNLHRFQLGCSAGIWRFCFGAGNFFFFFLTVCRMNLRVADWLVFPSEE